jgi:hypothetical protein
VAITDQEWDRIKTYLSWSFYETHGRYRGLMHALQRRDPTFVAEQIEMQVKDWMSANKAQLVAESLEQAQRFFETGP